MGLSDEGRPVRCCQSVAAIILAFLRFLFLIVVIAVGFEVATTIKPYFNKQEKWEEDTDMVWTGLGKFLVKLANGKNAYLASIAVLSVFAMLTEVVLVLGIIFLRRGFFAIHYAFNFIWAFFVFFTGFLSLAASLATYILIKDLMIKTDFYPVLPRPWIDFIQHQHQCCGFGGVKDAHQLIKERGKWGRELLDLDAKKIDVGSIPSASNFLSPRLMSLFKGPLNFKDIKLRPLLAQISYGDECFDISKHDSKRECYVPKSCCKEPKDYLTNGCSSHEKDKAFNADGVWKDSCKDKVDQGLARFSPALPVIWFTVFGLVVAGVKIDRNIINKLTVRKAQNEVTAANEEPKPEASKKEEEEKSSSKKDE